MVLTTQGIRGADNAYIFHFLCPNVFLIEPTETETKEELDGFIQAMEKVRSEMMNEPEFVFSWAHPTTPRLEDLMMSRLREIWILPGMANLVRHRQAA